MHINFEKCKGISYFSLPELIDSFSNRDTLATSQNSPIHSSTPINTINNLTEVPSTLLATPAIEVVLQESRAFHDFNDSEIPQQCPLQIDYPYEIRSRIYLLTLLESREIFLNSLLEVYVIRPPVLEFVPIKLFAEKYVFLLKRYLYDSLLKKDK